MQYYRIMNSSKLHIRNQIDQVAGIAGIRLLCGYCRYQIEVTEVVFREGYSPDTGLLCKRCLKISEHKPKKEG